MTRTLGRTHSAQRRNHADRRGMTLVELLMAVAITAVIGAAAVGMLFAVASGTDHRTDLRGAVVQHKTLESRLTAALREGLMVLAADDDFVVLWTADANGNGQPNFSELRRIEHSADQRTIVAYAASFPDGWTPQQIEAADTAWALDADFAALSAALRDTALFPGEVWARQVDELTFVIRPADVRQERLVGFQVRLIAGSVPQTIVGAAALRN